MTHDRDDDGIADEQNDPHLASGAPDDRSEHHDDPDDPEHDDDPQGMRGQLDDSMDGLEPGDDRGAAARGIPQG